MNIFERAYRAIVSNLTSPSAEVIEKDFLVSALPVAETALKAAAAVNPALGIAEEVLEPVINKELEK